MVTSCYPVIFKIIGRIEDFINMPGGFSIKKMTAPLKISVGSALILVVFLFQASLAPGAESLTQIQIPVGLSPGLTHLLNLADPQKQLSFQPDKIKKLLEFVEIPKDPGALYFADPKLGSPSAYFDFNVRQHFDHMLKYAFNPNLPGCLTAPSSIRFSHWKQVQSPIGPSQVLWKIADEQEAPLIVNGLEFVENTPDVFSGAYYSYDLYRTLILFKSNNRKVIISISKQKGKSDVGKKGYVLGSDDNWDYFYSGKPGLTKPGLGWVRSHMYDSYGINIYYEMDPHTPLVRFAAFKWVRAGWSKINVVKNHHIHNGIKRFAKSFKQIMEYPSLPGIDAFGDAYSKINAMTVDELKERIKIYLDILENRYGHNYRPPRAWSPQVLKDRSPWFQMSREAMQSVLMVEFMKQAMGKSDANAVVALLNPSK
jgi:hypothetical protein